MWPKTYNGVAFLCRVALTDVTRRFVDDGEKREACFLSPKIAGIHTICVYVPDGQIAGSEKYAYRLAWLEQLQRNVEQRCDPAEPLLLCRDLNIAPEDLEVCDPGVRAAFGRPFDWGLIDAFRLHHDEGKLYRWWDYRQLAFQKNQELRIDHMLVEQPLVKRGSNAFADSEACRGKGASDNAPVVTEFSE